MAVDSRSVGPGALFCALIGARHDGHEFLAQAARGGASAAVVERPVPDAPLPLLRVSDTRSAAAHLASLFRGDPAEDLRLFGVTGTNGKTTVTWILRHLLLERGPTASLGTLGAVGPGGSVTPGTLTTPDPIALMALLEKLRDEGVETLAMEVSSHALDQRRVDSLDFQGVAFTNLTREHLDYHRDMESYRAAKLRLLELLAPGGVCAWRAGEPAWEGLEARVEAVGGRPLTYGRAEGAEVRARDVELEPDGSRWSLETAGDSAELHLPLPGEFNVENALAAAALALHLGLATERIAERLGSVPPVPGRMEVLCGGPFLVLRDYAHTPDSFRRVLTGVRRHAAGRVILVFGCGGERDAGKRPLMGRVASDLADLTMVTTDNPRSEDPAEIAEQVTSDMAAGGFEVVLDREEAIGRALAAARPGDAVLLLGKGHETYQVVGRDRLPFDEKAIVTRLLAQPVGGA
ncbi:MAG: UDP-N-acetylmuramoyl-L-alanyl-D-glutamate--2,6-diaminopimelate ligase [Gemmatimonadota bacterium]